MRDIIIKNNFLPVHCLSFSQLLKKLLNMIINNIMIYLVT